MALRGLGKALQGLAERLIPGMLRGGRSVRETVETLREGGIDYGEQQMTEDVLGAQADLERAKISQPFDPDQPIPETFFRDRNYRTTWEYQYTFRYTYSIGDEIRNAEDFFSITTRERLSLNALAEDVQKAVEKRESYIGSTLEGVELFEGIHNVRRGKQ